MQHPYSKGKKVKRYAQEKQCIKNHAVEINEKILACFEQRFNSVYREDAQPFKKIIDDRDKIIFDVCVILNITVWTKVDDYTDDEVVLEKQISAMKNLLKVSKIRLWFQFNVL